MLNTHPIPAFKDNYIWVIHNRCNAVVVDPGIAQPVIAFLQENQLKLDAILITHHHGDHTGGIADLRQFSNVPVYGPATEAIAGVTHPLRERDQLDFPALSLQFFVLDIPGHTLGHIAYYAAYPFTMIFCGDTLFACGCGRIFEGTPQQMYQSLQKISGLPGTTRIYCAHEYTLSNLEFAVMLDPDNTKLIEFSEKARQLRHRNMPTIPTSPELERTINPFLRCTHHPIISRVQNQFSQSSLTDPIRIFSLLREWKNRF